MTPPAITQLTISRCDSDGNYDPNGDYAAISYAYSISTVNNKNTKTAVIQYKRSTGSSWSNLLTNSAYSANTTVYPSIELLSDYQWDIRLTVSDYFGSSEMTVTMPSAEVLMDLLPPATAWALERQPSNRICLILAGLYGSDQDQRMAPT